MARKSKNDPSSINAYAAVTATTLDEQPEKKTNYNDKSKSNLQTNHREKTPTTYMQINIAGYEDYLYRMAKYKNIKNLRSQSKADKKPTTTTVANYVLWLIMKDKQEHEAEYEALQKLPEYDKPHRESPNRKNRKKTVRITALKDRPNLNLRKGDTIEKSYSKDALDLLQNEAALNLIEIEEIEDTNHGE